MITEAMKLSETIVRKQFEELVNPGNFASPNFILHEWNIEAQISRILKVHHKTQDISESVYNDAIQYGSAIWKDLIEGKP